MGHQIFLLSPASSNGKRAEMVLREGARFDLAERLRSQGAPLGEVFSFVSGLYFRGKVAYSQTFADPPPDVAASFVITADRGLLSPDTIVDCSDLRSMSSVPIDSAQNAYADPLRRDLLALVRRVPDSCAFILLGSVATSKYVNPLGEVLGDRLLFPAEFVGRGDMSRGGLMLRSAESGQELSYVPVANATLHGTRPPRLPKLARLGRATSS